MLDLLLYLSLLPFFGMVLLAEQRISLTDLAKREDVAVSTVWRWTTRGVAGHRLEAFSVGGRKFTTEESFARWVEATNSATSGLPSPTVSAAHQQAIDAAEAEADRLGL